MKWEKCGKCKEKFPSEILSSMFNSGTGYSVRMCGVCALEERNLIHGLPKDTLFNGEVSNELYEEAKKIKENRNV